MNRGYHINAKGEPGACKANFSCPYGGFHDHFPTPEAAREAYEASQAVVAEPLRKTLHPNHAMLVQFDPLETAETSADVSELYAAAEVATPKIARALNFNQAVTGEVLVEARAKGDEHEYVDLERNPRYPVKNMTSTGMNARLWNMNMRELERIFNDPSIDDAFLANALGYPGSGRFDQKRDGIAMAIALANRDNKITSRTRGKYAESKPEFARAAARSGRWPLEADLQDDLQIDLHGETEVIRHEGTTREPLGSSFTRIRRGPHRPATLLLAAEESPTHQQLYHLGKHFKGTVREADFLAAVEKNKSSFNLRNAALREAGLPQMVLPVVEEVKVEETVRPRRRFWARG